MIEIQASWAFLCRVRFEALVKVGFTEDQVLDMLKAKGTMEL